MSLLGRMLGYGRVEIDAAGPGMSARCIASMAIARLQQSRMR